jgi:hypothetical protein
MFEEKENRKFKQQMKGRRDKMANQTLTDVSEKAYQKTGWAGILL